MKDLINNNDMRLQNHSRDSYTASLMLSYNEKKMNFEIYSFSHLEGFDSELRKIIISKVNSDQRQKKVIQRLDHKVARILAEERYK